MDVGAAVGLGYQLTNGPLKGMGMGIRYYQGVSNVAKFSSATVDSKFTNNVAQASLFYLF